MRLIITGATQGIGAGISRHLVQCGAKVICGYSENDKAAHALRDSLKNEKGEFILHKDDTTQIAGVKAIVQKALDSFGKVDALVSNLGPFLYRSIRDTTGSEWDNMVRANLTAHFYIVRELLPAMKSNGRGNFIFIGGVGSGVITGHPNSAAYNSAKVGLCEFMKTLAFEEARNNIRANMVAPGIIDNGEYSDNFRNRIINDIPMGCIGEPQDIANAVAWLLSDESRYVTGTVIDVSGGFHLMPR